MARQRARVPPRVSPGPGSPLLSFSFSYFPCIMVSRALPSLTHPESNLNLNRYNTFASAGSDGTVSIWDHKSKKRLRQYPKYHAPVPSIAFNSDGTRLAVGVSYTWEEGEEGAKTAERPAVFIKNVGEEVKVRIRFSSGYSSRAMKDGC